MSNDDESTVPSLTPPDREYMLCTSDEHGAVAARGPTAEDAVRRWVKTTKPPGQCGAVWARDNATGEVALVEWQHWLRVEDQGPLTSEGAKVAAILSKLPRCYHAVVDPTAIYIRRLHGHWITVARIEVALDGTAKLAHFWSDRDEAVIRTALGALLEGAV